MVKILSIFGFIYIFLVSSHTRAACSQTNDITELPNPPIYFNLDGNQAGIGNDKHDAEIWVFVFDSNYNHSGKCDRALLIKDLCEKEQDINPNEHKYYLDIANGQNHITPYIKYADLGVCLFKRDSQMKFQPSSFKEIGINSVELLEKSGAAVAGAVAKNQFAEWLLHSEPIYTVIGSTLFERSGGDRWPQRAMARLVFKKEQSNNIVTYSAYFRMVKKGYIRFGISPLTTYGFTIGNQGNAIILPLVGYVGYEILPRTDSLFYLGFDFFASPTIQIAEGQISQVLSLAMGPRLDVNGYIALGLGYKIDFTGTTLGSAIVSLTVGPELLRKVTGAKSTTGTTQDKTP